MEGIDDPGTGHTQKTQIINPMNTILDFGPEEESAKENAPLNIDFRELPQTKINRRFKELEQKSHELTVGKVDINLTSESGRSLPDFSTA